MYCSYQLAHLSSKLTSFDLNLVCCDWWLPRWTGSCTCEPTQFAVAATNHSAVSSDEMSFVDIMSDEVRW